MQYAGDDVSFEISGTSGRAARKQYGPPACAL